MARSSRFSIQPRREWYAVSRTEDLKREPQAVELLGERFVLYRSREGAPVAQLDRCPHRNVPLSGGRCLPDDTLECPYHGWRFRPDGSCAEIPGRVSLPKAGHRVETFATKEHYGLVWLCPVQGQVPHYEPQAIAEADSGEYTTIVRKVTFPGGLHAVVENALDVPHTSILHRRLFRSGDRNRVEVTLRRYKHWAEAEFVGEPPPTGFVARLLAIGSPKDLVVEHWDRFVLPHLLQVEYRLGKAHFLISGFCSPVSPERTDLYAVACIKTPLWGWLERLLVRLIEPFALKVTAQDCVILEQQTETIEHFGGEQFMSTEIDVLGNSITRLLKEAHEREEQGAEPDPARQPSEEEPREVAQIELDA